MIKNTASDSMENTLEITPIFPPEPGEAPDGYIVMPIPFEGLRYSLLGADIDELIDDRVENLRDIGVNVKEVKINFEPIFKSIALYTADLLGIKDAIYAGTLHPHSCLDDYLPFLFVPEKFYVEQFGKKYEYGFFVVGRLKNKLLKVIDEWYLKEYNVDEYGCFAARAVYAQWANGTNNGYEEILENLEIIT